MKIKIKLFNGQEMPKIIRKGEWIDLAANEDVTLGPPRVEGVLNDDGSISQNVVFDTKRIRLGVAMRLPDGFEAHVLPRSSTFRKTLTLLSNSQGIIDNSFCGDNDEWMYEAIALGHCNIKKGDRICQFRIELSQKATVWQKLRWLLSGKITLEETPCLYGSDRGGFGSTDRKGAV